MKRMTLPIDEEQKAFHMQLVTDGLVTARVIEVDGEYMLDFSNLLWTPENASEEDLKEVQRQLRHIHKFIETAYGRENISATLKLLLVYILNSGIATFIEPTDENLIKSLAYHISIINEIDEEQADNIVRSSPVFQKYKETWDQFEAPESLDIASLALEIANGGQV